MRPALAAASLRGLLALAWVCSCAHSSDTAVDDVIDLTETHAWISGQVIDETSAEGLEGIVVSLHSPLLAEPLQAITDASGVFTFEYHPPGNYALIIQAGESLATVRAALEAGQRWEPKLALDLPSGPTPPKLAHRRA